jgi:endonuclease III
MTAWYNQVMKMKIIDPQTQQNSEIVHTLLRNKQSQYTEAAHAEIFSRLINTIVSFNQQAAKTERVMLILAIAQVILAIAQIIMAVK